jgi:ADP-ribosylglycohydrolase
MMKQAVEDATTGVEPDVTLDRLRGWAAHEAIAAALYVFVRHPSEPRAAILEGANTPGDSDSIASIAGALVGARCGLGALPAEWVRDVERSEELLALAATTVAGPLDLESLALVSVTRMDMANGTKHDGRRVL